MIRRMFRRLAVLTESVFRRSRVESDIDEELHASFEMTVERFVARGLSLSEARRAARLEFDGLEQVKEKVRDGLAGFALHTFLQDARYGWRGLRRSPSFAAIALVTLALGIGVNTAVFSVFYAVLMRPLPYDRPEQLVRLWATYQSSAVRIPLSAPLVREIEHRNGSLAGIAGIWNGTPLIAAGDNPEPVKRARVTVNFFDVLGVRAARGRTFTKEDGGGPFIVIADRFFRGRFDADGRLVGRGVQVQETSTLVGVLPAGFQLFFAPDANVPADVQVFDTWGDSPPVQNLSTRAPNTAPNIIRAVARLKPGVSIAHARSDLDRVAAEIRAAYTDFNARNFRLSVEEMHADAFGDVQPALMALFFGAAFVLLICCVNVTSLLLTRASNRRGEIAIRLALGASRSRVLRQLLAEAGVLCLLAAAAGIALGWAGFRGLFAIRPERFAQIGDAGLMWPLLALTAAASLAATLLFALAPAVQSFRLDRIEALRGSSRGVLGRLRRRGGNLLVAGEIALGFVLVTGAALASRTLFHLTEVRPGFEPRQLLSFQLPRSTAVTELESELASLPGVEQAGAVSHLPLDTDIAWFGPYRPEGAVPGQSTSPVADNRCVTPGYFAAMQARLIEGRYFDRQDRDGTLQAAIVDESLARSAWPGQSAIGKKIDAQHVTANGFELVSSVVVGVVEHIHNHSLTKEVRAQIYTPFDQNQRWNFPATFVIRASVPPLSLMPAIRETLRRRAPSVAIGKVRPMTEYVDREIAPHRFTAVLSAIFGGLALLLAATGIYGVLNYRVSQRRREMGIRMAMGATVRNVLALVLREGLTLTAAGILLGAGATLAATRGLGSLVYGVPAYDPLSYGLALLLLPAAALLGCWQPARRAAAANPGETIREE